MIIWMGILVSSAALFLSLRHLSAETHERGYLFARQEQDWQTAIIECDKVYDASLLTLDELSTPVLYYRAEAKFMQQDYSGALQDNLEALRAHPNHFYTLNNIGSCYVKLSNFRLGEVFYRKSLAISPHFEESLLNLTALYFNQREYEKAWSEVSRCDTTQPGSRAQSMSRVVRSFIR